LALAESSCNQLRDVPEKQLHFRIPKILSPAEEGENESFESVAGIGQTYVPLLPSSQLPLSRARFPRKRSGIFFVALHWPSYTAFWLSELLVVLSIHGNSLVAFWDAVFEVQRHR
jgi:hypothetical protein